MHASLLRPGLLILALLSMAGAAAAPLGGRVVAFGDSLSDVGNDFALTLGAVPPPPRYDRGRFTNGPIWAEPLAEALGAALKPSEGGFDLADSVSFAYGGAGTQRTPNPTPGGFLVPGVLGQVALYRDALAGQPADGSALHVLWGGANDYLLGLTTDPSASVGNIETAIEELYALGARHVLVPNLPDLGATPIAQALGAGAALSALTDAHNSLLRQALADLGASLTGISLTPLDVHALFARILADPAAFGFGSGVVAGPASGCLLPPFDCSPVGFDTDAFFWDEQHPSTAVHRLIAEAARGALGIPEPPAWALLAAGFVGLAARRLSPRAACAAAAGRARRACRPARRG